MLLRTLKPKRCAPFKAAHRLWGSELKGASNVRLLLRAFSVEHFALVPRSRALVWQHRQIGGFGHLLEDGLRLKKRRVKVLIGSKSKRSSNITIPMMSGGSGK